MSERKQTSKSVITKWPLNYSKQSEISCASRGGLFSAHSEYWSHICCWSISANILMRLKQHDLNNRLRGSVWFLSQKLCSNWQMHFWIRIFFFGPEPIHKKEWHVSSYILFELSTLCKQLIFSGKCFMFTWVKIQLCSVNLHSITNGFTKSQFLSLLFIQTRCNCRSCSCQTLWEALCLRFYLRTVSRFMKSLTLIKRLVWRAQCNSPLALFFSPYLLPLSQPDLLTARRLSAGSDGTWIPPRMPTTRTRRRWWSAWTLWRKPCSGRARADSTASRAGRKARPRRSPPPPWFLTTARGR